MTHARKALIVGVDYYEHVNPLTGCVNDARSVYEVLRKDADGTPNFPSPRVLTGTNSDDAISRQELKEAIRELFADDCEVALFYFSGHGFLEDTGGFLCTSDARDGDDGVSLNEVMSMANNSPATTRLVILDSCHSGSAGRMNLAQGTAISEGVTILAASTAEQYALESDGSGVFTNLFVDALSGGAANLVGDVTPGSVYAHIDQSLGPWQQRPVFKTNVKGFVSLRKAVPPIPVSELHKLTDIFVEPHEALPLDPSYEPKRSESEVLDSSILDPDPSNTATFATLQALVKVNLVRPVGTDHMYYAAMESRSCELTVLG